MFNKVRSPGSDFKLMVTEQITSRSEQKNSSSRGRARMTISTLSASMNMHINIKAMLAEYTSQFRMACSEVMGLNSIK